MKKRTNRGVKRGPGSAEHSLFYDINRGSAISPQALEFGKLLTPESITGNIFKLGDQECYHRCRWALRENHLVRQFALLKRGFLNYGFHLRAARKKDADKLKKWLSPDGRDPRARANRKQVAAVKKFVNDALLEWVGLDAAIGFWTGDAPPTLLQPEDIKYSDLFGQEKIIITNPPSIQDLKAAGASADVIARYSRKPVILSEEEDEYWAVLKRQATGKGLGRPRLEAFMEVIDQMGSMEAGEKIYAYASRAVIRQHKLGHSITGGNRAGLPAHFAKKPRLKAVQDFFRNKAGKLEFAGNFDHEILLHWIDPAKYDHGKWKTVIDRLVWWAGAAPFLYLAETLRPYLLRLLEVECNDDAERPTIKLWLEEILNAAFDIPVPVTVNWSNRCFTEPNIADDMLRFLATQGDLSTQTLLNERGYDFDQEVANKQAEKKIETDNPGSLTPLFDAAHGNQPGAPEVNPGGSGRPKGSANAGDV